MVTQFMAAIPAAELKHHVANLDHLELQPAIPHAVPGRNVDQPVRAPNSSHTAHRPDWLSAALTQAFLPVVGLSRYREARAA